MTKYVQKCPRNRTANKKNSSFEEKNNGLDLKLRHRKALKMILCGTHTGEQEISAVLWRLPDNLGELTCMTYMYFINVSYKWNNIFKTKFLDEL